MSFQEIFDLHNWDKIREDIYSKTTADVEHALNKNKLTLEDFKTLISPSAEGYLEAMASKSQLLTLQRFGKTIQLYAPLYLSNECQNICTYCGFSLDNKIRRKKNCNNNTYFLHNNPYFFNPYTFNNNSRTSLVFPTFFSRSNTSFKVGFFLFITHMLHIYKQFSSSFRSNPYPSGRRPEHYSLLT